MKIYEMSVAEHQERTTAELRRFARTVVDAGIARAARATPFLRAASAPSNDPETRFAALEKRVSALEDAAGLGGPSEPAPVLEGPPGTKKLPPEEAEKLMRAMRLPTGNPAGHVDAFGQFVRPIETPTACRARLARGGR